MNISEEALEAAAEALYELERGKAGWRPFSEMPLQYIKEWREQAKVAIYAAAPHLLAEAWDEGWEARADIVAYDLWGGEEPASANPHRSQK